MRLSKFKLKSKFPSWRIYLAVMALLFSLLSSLTGTAISYAANDPGTGNGGGGGGSSSSFTLPANGFNWKMLDRFGSLDSRGIVDFHWNEQAGLYSPGYIHPDKFDISFYGCQSAAEDTAGNNGSNTYTWAIQENTPSSPFTKNISSHNCRQTVSVPRQGAYNVKFSILLPNGSAYQGKTPFAEQDIVVKDLLIVAIGDSYGAGEGSPDVEAKNNGGTPIWQDKRCHRSANAPSAQTALALERSDPHISVTYISFACSGANVNRNYNHGNGPLDDPFSFDPYKLGDPTKPDGSGILGPYRGIEPLNPDSYVAGSSDYLASQIDQLKAAVGSRQIDALLMSAGGNDMGFAPLAKACVLYTDCFQAPVYDMYRTNAYRLDYVFQDDLNAMRGRYDALQTALNSINPKKVYITQYPDPTHDGAGNLCDTILGDTNLIPGLRIDRTELTWLYNTVLPGMNGQVQAAAQRNNWVYVDHIAEDFATHGYCALNNWINKASQSSDVEGSDNATLHPNKSGYTSIASRLTAKVQPDLIIPATGKTFMGDVNGDGKADQVMAWDNNGSTNIRVAFSQDNGYYGTTVNNTFPNWPWSDAANSKWFIGDVNGDGKADLTQVYNKNGSTSVRVALSSGNGGYLAASVNSNLTYWFFAVEPNARWFMSDVNGDGKADLVMVWNNNGNSSILVALSRGDGTYATTANSNLTYWFFAVEPNARWLVNDVNGDGKADMVMIWNNNGNSNVLVALSRGDGTYATTANSNLTYWGYGAEPNNQWFFSDVNGDGKADLVMTWNNNGVVNVLVSLSRGDGTYATSANSSTPWSYPTAADGRWFLSEVNGDGKADLVMISNNNGSTKFQVALSAGNGTFTPTPASYPLYWGFGIEPYTRWFMSDVNGDGKTDLVMQWNNNETTNSIVGLSQGNGAYANSASSNLNNWFWIGGN